MNEELEVVEDVSSPQEETETHEEPQVDYQRLYEESKSLLETQNKTIANLTRQLESKPPLTDGDLFEKYSKGGRRN